MRYRIETDSIGELKIPAESYYGIHTARSAATYSITKRGINRQMIKALTIVKKAAAKANMDSGEITNEIGTAIIASCDEILNGRLHGQFITDLIQGGAGFNMNMNANEVIANRANEMLGGKKGTYEFVHPINHVNLNQTTNDVIPTAGKIAITKQIKKLQVELKKIQNSFVSKGKELANANLVSLGQVFTACSNVLNRDLKRIDQAITNLSELNMGVSVIGKDNSVNPKYLKKIVYHINKYSGEDFVQAKDLCDATRNVDAFVNASSVLNVLATNLSKIANDIILFSAANMHEFNHINVEKSLEEEDTIGVLDIVKQIAFYVDGLDVMISRACGASTFEINVYNPIVLMSIFDQLSSLRRGIRTMRERYIDLISIKK